MTTSPKNIQNIKLYAFSGRTYVISRAGPRVSTQRPVSIADAVACRDTHFLSRILGGPIERIILSEDDYRIEGFSAIYCLIFQKFGGEGGIRTFDVFIIFNRLQGNRVQIVSTMFHPCAAI